MLKMSGYEIPVVIVGGGIAGLWLLNRLRQRGVAAVLLERSALGGVQTIASQGIIHGGAKYALKGKLTDAATTTAQMTKCWAACFAGAGEVDLSQTAFLSPHHYLWNQARFSGGLKGVIASKALSSENRVLKRTEYPAFLQHDGVKGSVCELDEVVLDVPGLVEALVAPCLDAIVAIDAEPEFDCDAQGVRSIRCVIDGETMTLQAQHVVLTAGEGNEACLSAMGADLMTQMPMQRRPLQMVWARFQAGQAVDAAFVHCVDKGMLPRVTVTSHRTADGRWVWYLGGALAEEGVALPQAEQVAKAKVMMQGFFPWVDFDLADWGSVMIQRAEGLQPHQRRPDGPVVQQWRNVQVAWPTKFTLAPAMVDQVEANIPFDDCVVETLPQAIIHGPKPTLAQQPWEK